VKRFLWLLPPLLCLLYASLLLAARHLPEVRGHWQALVQAPRLVVGAAALGLAMWLRMRRQRSDASRLVGLLMAGGAGAIVVLGTWGVWWQVRGLAALCWLATAAVAARAR